MHEEEFEEEGIDVTDIAIVGMGCRLPGANSPQQFWENVQGGVESITPLSDEALKEAGVSDALINNPNYVKKAAILDNMEMFDAGFFNFSPAEASMMDPQHRHFLECSWEALEHAGYDPSSYDGAIGVFAGSGHNAYMPYNLFTNPAYMKQHGLFLVRHTGNDKDFLTTRASYCFNLKGPSVNVQTACSTSLVAMHLASQSLQSHESDIALAGGVTIELPHRQGYLYTEGEILSPDGHCRAFDATSKGTVFGSGVGVVVMKRLEDALDDGDTVYAVIKSSAVNNDGSGKVSYMAPSVDGQAAAIHEALTVAEIDPETIDYIECHGTGTPIGDPIEITALTNAFREETESKQFCGVGSVKSNIGHLDTAAGVAGMIKVVQALKNQQVPPSISFESHNPAIDWENSPFKVNDELKPWDSNKGPRRAGVSSLGVGGTNAHIIVEEAPELDETSDSSSQQLFVLSARSKAALDAQCENLAAAIEKQKADDDFDLADVAYTLKVGRKPFEFRQIISADNADHAVALLKDKSSDKVFRGQAPEKQRDIAFMMAGGGAQYPNMGLDLYNEEPVFKEALDECFELISQFVDFDLKALMFPADADLENAAIELQRPSRSVTSLFVTQYAQAKLWQSWGIEPKAFIGHSLGENTAACLAGVFSLKDALGLVALRGQLFEKAEAGGMLSVQLSEQDVRSRLPAALDIAAANAPELVVVSGPIAELEAFQKVLESEEVECQRVRINIAAHSRMLEPILEEFGNYLRSIKLSQPEIKIVSNLTGDWLCPIKASTPDYWVDHLRNTVRFGEGVNKLLADNQYIALEIGPGRTLSSLAKMADEFSRDHTSLQAMRSSSDESHDLAFMLEALGKLWIANAVVDWKTFYGDEFRRRVALPTYPFEHKKYWVEPGTASASAGAAERREKIEEWGSQPVWEPTYRSKEAFQSDQGVVAIIGEHPAMAALSQKLTQSGVRCLSVKSASGFQSFGSDQWSINFGSDEDWSSLWSAMKAASAQPTHIVMGEPLNTPSNGDWKQAMATSYQPLYAFAKAISAEELKDTINLLICTSGAATLQSDVDSNALAALVTGPLTIIPAEIKEIATRQIDLAMGGDWVLAADGIAQELATERAAGVAVALRGKRSFERKLRNFDAPKAQANAVLNAGDTVLITGGLGGLGLEMAEAVTEEQPLNLVLVNRRAFPSSDQWESLSKQAGPMAEKARQLIRLQEKGNQVLVQAADITSSSDMSALKDKVIATFGKLDAIVHTAGVIDDGLIAMKEDGTAERVLAPKVAGTLCLTETFSDQNLKRVVLFSSSSSFSGLAGQIDYASANAFLDAYAQGASVAGETNVIAVNWPAWKESGMAARMANHQLDTLSSEQASHPWLGVVGQDDDQSTVYQRYFSVANDWVLSEHRIKGAGSLLPGTSYLELARAAYAEKFNVASVKLSNVIFLAPCFVNDSEEVIVQVALNKDGTNTEFSISSFRQGEWVEHAKGNVGVATSEAGSVDVAALQATCTQEKAVPAGGTDQPSLEFGQRWHCASVIRLGEREAYLELKLKSEFVSDLEWAHLHPALLDIATAGAQSIVPNYDPTKDFMVPLGYSSIESLQPLTSDFVSHVTLHDAGTYEKSDTHDDATVTFNVTMADKSGNVLVKVNDFTMKRVKPDFSQPAVGEEEIDPLLQETMNMGITNQEGRDAFKWLFNGVQLPQVIVSPCEINHVLDALYRAANNVTERSGPVVNVDRDSLTEEFVEPSTDLQKKIAEIWGEVLGVDQVGIRDNFFELGGHSLLLTRVGTKLKKQFKQELPMSLMFKDPTIEKWSAVLEANTGEDAPKKKTSIKRASRDALRKKRS